MQTEQQSEVIETAPANSATGIAAYFRPAGRDNGAGVVVSFRENTIDLRKVLTSEQAEALARDLAKASQAAILEQLRTDQAKRPA